MATNNGGAAFPSAGVVLSNQAQRQQGAYEGMTLRDYFAAKAMQAILAHLTQGIRPQDCISAADDAYFLADAMLKAREQ